jgi:hypothetical protein
VGNVKPVYVILMGGLGNQLFQISAALSISKDNPIYIDWKIAKPRLNAKGLPEIVSFQLPPNIRLLDNKEANSFQRKTFGYLLRMGLNEKTFQNRKLVNRFKVFIGSIIFSFRFRKPVQATVAKSLGYSVLAESILSKVMIGYFQSYIWTEKSDVYQKIVSLKSLETSNAFLKLKEESGKRNPLVLHLRFGDYVNEPSFGILTQKYYSDSIKLATESQEYGEVWVFSDEIERARQVLNFHTELPLRFIDDLGNSTSINFDAMRLGRGFIMANSSFSWWAARLSGAETKLVIAPKPWFRGLEDDSTLIPPSWLRIEGHD